MQNNKADSKIDYSLLEHQRSQVLQNQLKSQLRHRAVGKNDSLRRTVLHLVVEGDYESAEATIDFYLEHKRHYPALYERCSAQAQHAKQLINAVRTKRNFPNLSLLTMSKQQEVLEFAISHFEELKMTLKTMEHIVRDEAIKDIRASVWVVRTLVYSVLAVVLTAFFCEFYSGLAKPFWVVYSGLTDNLFGILASYLTFL